jgi:hypothetical protein
MAGRDARWHNGAMSPLNECVHTLISLSTANRPDGIWPVNQAVDAFISNGRDSLGSRITALIELGRAFEARAPATDLAVYAKAVIDQRRRLLELEWWQRHREGRVEP